MQKSTQPAYKEVIARVCEYCLANKNSENKYVVCNGERMGGGWLIGGGGFYGIKQPVKL